MDEYLSDFGARMKPSAFIVGNILALFRNSWNYMIAVVICAELGGHKVVL